MNCPYCGAELQENARFCLYCMKSLQEKQPIETPPANSRQLRIALIAAVAAAAALVVAFLLPGRKTERPAAAEMTAESTAQQDLPPITDLNTFYFSAVDAAERLAAQDLWEPSSMWFPADTRANVPLLIPGASCQVDLLDNGAAILATVTDLTEETLADGQRLADCIAEAVYDGNATLPSLQNTLPPEPADGAALALLGLNDPTGVTLCRVEPECPGASARQFLLYVLQTRTADGVAAYDIFLYFGQE